MDKSTQNDYSMNTNHQNQLSFDMKNHFELSKFPMKKDESAFIDVQEFITDVDHQESKKHNISNESLRITVQDENQNLQESKRKSENVKSPSKLVIPPLTLSRKRSKQQRYPFDEKSETSIDNHNRKELKAASIIKGNRMLKLVVLYQNIKSFIDKLTKNSRISSQLTQTQHKAIADISSTFGNKKIKKSLKNFKLNVQSLIFVRYFNILTLFSPYSIQKRLWDTLQVVLILVLFYFISLSIFFELDVDGEILMFYKVCLVLFLVDTLVTLNTGIILKGQVNFSRKDITKNYFKEYFLSDIFGNSSLLLFLAQDSFQSNYYKSIQILIIMKWVKLRDIFMRLSFYLCYEKNQKNMLDLIRLLFLLIGVCHVFCSFWHGMALYEISIGFKNTWLHHLNLVDSPIMKRYAYSFYYLSVTMITVGYGDVTPQNPLEIVFTITTMFVTGMVYAFSLNTIGSIIDNIEKKDKKYKENMQVIHGLMREENVSRDLRTKISNYLEYLYKLNLIQTIKFISEKESNEVLKNQQKSIIETLSSQLQRDFILDVRGKYLQDIPFFISLNQKNQIVFLMEETLYSPGEYIFQEENRDDCSLYYIVKGQVQLIHNKKESQELVLSTKEKSQYFGEISFITGCTRRYSARASDFCRIYKINRQSFLNAIRQDEHDYETFLMLKDIVIFKYNYNYGQIGCFTCKSTNHLCIDCPKTHLVLAKSTVYQRFNFTQIHSKRSKEGRVQRNKQKSVLIIDHCRQGIFEINDREEYFDILDEIEKGINYSERGDTQDYTEDMLECIVEEDEHMASQNSPTYQYQKNKSIHSTGSSTVRNQNKLLPTRKSLDLSTQQALYQATQLSTLQDFDKNQDNIIKSRMLSSSKSSEQSSSSQSSQSSSSSSSSSSLSKSPLHSQPQSPNRAFNRAKSLFSNMSSINDNKQMISLLNRQNTQNSVTKKPNINYEIQTSFDINQINLNYQENYKNQSDSRIKTFRSVTECLDKNGSDFNVLQQNVQNIGQNDTLSNSGVDQQIVKKFELEVEKQANKVGSISSIGSNQPYSRLPSRYLQQQEKKLNSQLSLDQQKKKDGIYQNLNDQNQIINSSFHVNSNDNNIQKNEIERFQERPSYIRHHERNSSQISLKKQPIRMSNLKRSVSNQEQLQQSIGQFMKNLKQFNPNQYYDYLNPNSDKKNSKSIKPSFFSQKGPSIASFISAQNLSIIDQSKFMEKMNLSTKFEDKMNTFDLNYELFQTFENAFSFKYYFPYFNYSNVIERQQKYHEKKLDRKKRDKKPNTMKKQSHPKQKQIQSNIQ